MNHSATYRAVLVDPGLDSGRPVQVISSSRTDIDNWTNLVLASARAENACVLVYQSVETQVGLVMKPKREEEKK